MTEHAVDQSSERPMYTIRKFELQDLDQVMEINRRCLPENYHEGFFRTIYSELPSAFIVCELEGAIIGYTMARLETGMSLFSIFHRAKKGHTVSIAVLSEYRRQGIGTQLLNKSIQAMINSGATELFLEVRISNESAVAMYQSLDYKVIKEIHNYYRDFESAFLMGRKVKE